MALPRAAAPRSSCRLLSGVAIDMSRQLGPILKFLGADDDGWHVSVLLAAPAAAMPHVACPASESMHATLLARHGCGVDAVEVRSFRFAIPQTPFEQRVRYDVDGAVHSFVVPARGAAPTCAYTSCNGFSDPKVIKKVREPNAMWRRYFPMAAEKFGWQPRRYNRLCPRRRFPPCQLRPLYRLRSRRPHRRTAPTRSSSS